MTQAITTMQIATPDDDAYFAMLAAINIFAEPAGRTRVLMERAIVRRVCIDLVAAGYMLRLHDGEFWATKRTTDVAVIMKQLMGCDTESLIVTKADPEADGKFLRFGSIDLVYGNDGHDVICDYTTNLEDALAGATAYADALAELVQAGM